MEEMQILTTWFVDDSDPDDPINQRGIRRDYPILRKVTDYTGTPTENIPNDPLQCVCRIVGETALLDTIEADPNYTVLPGTRGPYNG
jgi:hypothetical protein